MDKTQCRRFQPNRFDECRCLHCFKPKDVHTEAALHNGKMARKKTKYGYLYIAPDNFDADDNSQKNRRWQRRWFVLYDDGELAYSLDQHPETVPQGVIDMNRCKDLKSADDVTKNAHSLTVAIDADKRYFFKADTSDDIRWWLEVLSPYPKRYVIKGEASNGDSLKTTDKQKEIAGSDQGTQFFAQEYHAREGAASNHRLKRQQDQERWFSDPWSRAKVDITRNDSFHGTPRSVKNRKTMRQKDDTKTEQCDKLAASESSVETASSPTPNVTSEIVLHLNRPSSSMAAEDTDESSSSVHTLRKGWLMLRGRSDSDWTKHWVVLAGLSLKLFKNAWAEDTGGSVIRIDLGQIDQVLPICVTRSYGIELRCKHSRYIVSAVTPGIRDSWISAIKQNIAAAVASARSANIDNASIGVVQKHKRIAYVAPESHNRFASTDESATDDDEDAVSFRSSSRADEGSVSESLFDSGRELGSEEEAACSGSSTPRRRRSLSPTVRRSPVSRVKERNRRQRSPASQHPDPIRSSQSPPPVVAHCVISAFAPVASAQTNYASTRSVTLNCVSDRESARVSMLQCQLESVRNELQRTRERLNSTAEENERLKNADHDTGPSGCSAEELDRLRRGLGEAERDMLRKRDEIESLQRKLDFSVNDLSETENAMTESLRHVTSTDIHQSRRRLSADWNRRVTEMENQLRDAIGRLDRRRERDSREKIDRVKEMQILQRRHEEMQRTVESLSRRLKDAERATFGVDRDGLIEQLEEKLSDSEKKITALADKVKRLEVNLDSDSSSVTLKSSSNGISTDEGLSVHDAVDDDLEPNGKCLLEKSTSKMELFRDKQPLIEGAAHHCREQNRRLLAALKNQAEFLQCLLSDGSESSSSSSTKPVSKPSEFESQELSDLADDLAAVQQYLNDFDPSDDDNGRLAIDRSKDFRFKDVLNRLIETQEKLTTIRRSEKQRLTVSDVGKSRDAASKVTVAEYEAKLKLLHERIDTLSGGARSASVCRDNNLNCSSMPNTANRNSVAALPLPSSSEFLWDYPISLLHEDLAKNASRFLKDLFEPMTFEAQLVAKNGDLESVLTRAMSAEICLVIEIANLIEASSCEERLSCSVLLRDIRNTYSIVKKFDAFLAAPDDRNVSPVHKLDINEIDINCFGLYHEKMNEYLSAQWRLYLACLPEDYSKLFEFNDSLEETIAARRYLAEYLMVAPETISSAGNCSALDCFREAVLNEELGHLLARIQVTFEAADKSWDRRRSLSLIATAFAETEILKSNLNVAFETSIADVLRSSGDPSNSTDYLVERLRQSVIEYLNRLKSNGSLSRLPLTASGTKLVYIEKSLSAELDAAVQFDTPLNASGVERLGQLLYLRGTANGLIAWLHASTAAFYAKYPYSSGPTTLVVNGDVKSFDKDEFENFTPPSSRFPQTTIVSQYSDAVAAGLTVNKIADRYEPLTKQLLYQTLTNAMMKLASASLRCHYEAEYERLKSRQTNSSSFSCDQCAVLYQHVDTLIAEKERLKRRSLCEPLAIDAALNIQKGRDFRHEMAVMEMKFESERCSMKAELDRWKEWAEVGSNATNLKNEVAELEQELVEVQAAHNEELEALRASYRIELDDLRHQLQNDQERRKRLGNDMQNMKRLNDQSLEAVERNHAQLLEEIRKEQSEEIERLTTEYEEQLREEKEATRQALDALQKAHELEMSRQVQKARDEHQHPSSLSSRVANGEDWSRKKSHDFRDMLERMNKEVYELSTAYSAKCLENSLIEDELDEARQILERISKSSSSEVAENMKSILEEMKRAKSLQTKLSMTEAELNVLKQKIKRTETEFHSRGVSNDFTRHSSNPPASVEPARQDAIDCTEYEEESSVAAEYTPKGSRVRRINSRRNDSRYYSSPNLDRGSDESAVRRRSLTPDSIIQELRQAMGLPVAERRKFFENLGKQSSI